MENSQNLLFINRFISFSKFSSLLVILIGMLTLIGWIFDVPELRSVFLGFQTMKVNTAFVFILIGVTLQLNLQEKQSFIYLKIIGGIVILLVGLLTLSQYIFKINLGIDQLLFTDLHTASDASPGRMSFASAFCFSLIGSALLFLNSQKEKVRTISQHLAVVVLIISFLALMGYVYEVQALYIISDYSSLGLNTATAFVLSSLAILWARPAEGWTKIITTESAGGSVLRRLLLPIIGVPLVLGWLVLLGTRVGLYETRFGLAIISVLIAGFLFIALFLNSRQINFVDRKRKLAEEGYRNVLDHMMEGAQIIGFDWRYLYVNDSVAKQGHQTKEKLLGRTMMEAYPGIENTELFEILTHCMQERVSHLMENEFTYPDGKKGWFELSIQPVREGLFILSNNVTERKHAEERFHLTVESAPNAIILINSNGNIILVNSQAEVFFRYSHEELLGLHIDSLVPERYRTGHAVHRKGFLSDPQIRAMGIGRDLYGLRKDGSEFPVEIGLAPIESHGEMLVMATVVDITERKHNEEALLKLNAELELRVFERTANFNLANERLQNELLQRQQAETRYRALFEQSNDAVFILDFQGNHIMANQHAADLLGYTGEEILSLSYKDLSAETEKSEQVLKRLLAGERIPFFERLFRKKSGEIFPVEINVELVRDDSGIPLHIQSVVRDITKRKQDEETTHRQNKMLSELHKITLDLLKQNSLEQLLKRIVEISSEFLDASYAGITLIEGEELVLMAVTQNRASALGQRFGRDDAKLTWQAFDSKKTMVLSNYDSWPNRRKQHQGFPRYAVIDIPILNGDECLGVLALGREKPNHEFSEEQIQFGSLFASLTALIIINSQLRETLKQQSIHDSLTGLFNRRYMEETLKQEISRAARQNHPLGIIMLDIDHFKNFNDSFGHLAGDSLLSQLGQFLQTNIRTEDVACRYGGEEFLLIMPNVSLETVKKRAELLREGISKLQMQADTWIGVTVSFGVGMYPQHGETMESLIRSADTALYRAKQNGRNRVEVSDAKSTDE